jgi:hypothetical protein
MGLVIGAGAPFADLALLPIRVAGAHARALVVDGAEASLLVPMAASEVVAS